MRMEDKMNKQQEKIMDEILERYGEKNHWLVSKIYKLLELQ